MEVTVNKTIKNKGIKQLEPSNIKSNTFSTFIYLCIVFTFTIILNTYINSFNSLKMRGLCQIVISIIFIIIALRWMTKNIKTRELNDANNIPIIVLTLILVPLGIIVYAFYKTTFLNGIMNLLKYLAFILSSLFLSIIFAAIITRLYSII